FCLQRRATYREQKQLAVIQSVPRSKKTTNKPCADAEYPFRQNEPPANIYQSLFVQRCRSRERGCSSIKRQAIRTSHACRRSAQGHPKRRTFSHGLLRDL